MTLNEGQYHANLFEVVSIDSDYRYDKLIDERSISSANSMLQTASARADDQTLSLTHC